MALTGLITDVKPFAVHDGPGIRTTLFFKRCPLRCLWCHNPETQSVKPQLFYYAEKCIGCGICAKLCSCHKLDEAGHSFDRAGCRACGACAQECPSEALMYSGCRITVEEAFELVASDREFYRISKGGVTLSGGEPLLQTDFCTALLEKLHAEKIHTALDTCGAVPWEAFERVLPVTDLVLYDIKAITPELHRACTGMGNEKILENLRRLNVAGVPVEVRVPLFPGVNDSDREIEKMGVFFDTLWHGPTSVRLLRGHALARSKYAALGLPDTIPAVPEHSDSLTRAAAILTRHRVKLVD